MGRVVPYIPRPRPKPPISPEERARRREAVDFARGNVRLSGFILDPQTEALNARYIAGELDHDELNEAIKALCRVDELIAGSR